MKKDIYIANLSDMHSGGMTSLLPDYPIELKYGKEVLLTRPTPAQKAMYQHWLKSAERIKTEAKGKRLVIVHNGDAIEGNHHYTIQLISPLTDHHKQIHVELMEEFLKRCGFSRKNGDNLHYTSGTESHTGWSEGTIADEFDHLGATFDDELILNLNGREIWYSHHGAAAGGGANEGDAYRNWLKRVYWDCKKQGRKIPDLICSAHYHKSIKQSYEMDYHVLHGMITPSWQKKTRFAIRVAPFEKNDIGYSPVIITADGDMRFPRPFLLNPELLR